jgi:hypothetical protein
MAPQFDRPLRDLLRAAGCTLVRQGKGSHEIWHSPQEAAAPFLGRAVSTIVNFYGRTRPA